MSNQQKNARQGSAQQSRPVVGPAAAAAVTSPSGSLSARPASASKLAGARPTILAPVAAVARPPAQAKAPLVAELGLKDAIELVMQTPKPDRLRSSCVLLIDATSRAATFLRHRDVNYLSAMDKDAMSAERVRRALIGAIRYQKPIAIGKNRHFIFDFLIIL
jgi:hypothetical protein